MTSPPKRKSWCTRSHPQHSSWSPFCCPILINFFSLCLWNVTTSSTSSTSCVRARRTTSSVSGASQRGVERRRGAGHNGQSNARCPPVAKVLSRTCGYVRMGVRASRGGSYRFESAIVIRTTLQSIFKVLLDDDDDDCTVAWL